MGYIAHCIVGLLLLNLGVRAAAAVELSYVTTWPLGIPGAGLAADSEGNLYAAGGNMIRKYSPNGSYISGMQVGTATTGIALALDGSLFSAGLGFPCITHVNQMGEFISNWGCRFDFLAPADSCFVTAFGVFTTPEGIVGVVDSNLGRVLMFRGDGTFLKKLTVPGGWYACYVSERGIYMAAADKLLLYSTDGLLLGEWGGTGEGPGQFQTIGGITTDSRGTLYVVDRGNRRFVAFDYYGQYLGAWPLHVEPDRELPLPLAIAASPAGAVYVADFIDGSVQVFAPIPVASRSTSWGRVKAAYR
jgi:hypothetical protein